MQKERAASALQRGLPVPTPLPTRARAAESSRTGGSSAPPTSRTLSDAPNGRRMPLAVKLLGVGLAVLGVVYGLTLFRDHKSVSAAPAVIDAAVK
jgi:hypothetical protein